MLLNKLLEDGNTLFKKDRLSEAAHRYQYALRRIPGGGSAVGGNGGGGAGVNMGRNKSTFEQLTIHLLLNLSRCKRKAGHLTEAVDMANRVLAINPDSFEAHYAKAKANKEAGRLHEAVNDLTEALRVAGPNNRGELHRVILRIKEEIAANEEKTSSDDDDDDSAKDLSEKGMGEIKSHRQTSIFQEADSSTSGVDSSTGSSSFNGAGSNERNSSYANNIGEKEKLAESFDEHSTSLII